MRLEIPTPHGPAWADVDEPEPGTAASAPTALLVLGHGAGGGIEAPDLLGVRRCVRSAGVAVARVTQPYRVAGRRAAAPAAQLDAVWTAVCAELDRPGLPLVVGGRSSGARVACRTAAATGAAAVVALAFPVHPPGRPEKDRLAELALPLVPVLVVQGERDPFGMPPPDPTRRLVVVAGDHALRKAAGAVGAAVSAFLVDLGLAAPATDVPESPV